MVHRRGVQQGLAEELRAFLTLPLDEGGLRWCLDQAMREYRLAYKDTEPDSIRSPRLFGLLTRHVLNHPTISREAKRRVCWTLFDVIQLPETEDEAFLTEVVVPRGLQEAVNFFLTEGEFVEYHLLHLIYALYLDAERASQAGFQTLLENLTRIASEDVGESLKLLYAYLLMSSPSLSDSHSTELLTSLLKATGLKPESKRQLCLAALDPTFGTTWFVERAKVEGLYPASMVTGKEVAREVRVRPLPGCLAPAAEKWLVTEYDAASSGEEG